MLSLPAGSAPESGRGMRVGDLPFAAISPGQCVGRPCTRTRTHGTRAPGHPGTQSSRILRRQRAEPGGRAQPGDAQLRARRASPGSAGAALNRALPPSPLSPPHALLPPPPSTPSPHPPRGTDRVAGVPEKRGHPQPERPRELAAQDRARRSAGMRPRSADRGAGRAPGGDRRALTLLTRRNPGESFQGPRGKVNEDKKRPFSCNPWPPGSKTPGQHQSNLGGTLEGPIVCSAPIRLPPASPPAAATLGTAQAFMPSSFHTWKLVSSNC